MSGVVRVVLVKEDHGWHAFFCTDPNASVAEILEAFADRATIEQDFHDVKEVWGAGQQQVRNIWTNVAVYNMNLWMHTLVELWAWTLVLPTFSLVNFTKCDLLAEGDSTRKC